MPLGIIGMHPAPQHPSTQHPAPQHAAPLHLEPRYTSRDDQDDEPLRAGHASPGRHPRTPLGVRSALFLRSMHALDWAVVVIYLVWIVYDGLRRSKGTDKVDGYFLAN